MFVESAMMVANESARQDAVDRLDLASKRGDVRLQRVAERAAYLASAPIGAISIVDRAHQWTIALHGPLPQEIPRALSFCARAIHRPGEVMVVADAALDTRFANNPLVAKAPPIRFYVGIPLVDRGGYPLGALCVIDHAPRTQMPDLYELTALAREAERIVTLPH